MYRNLLLKVFPVVAILMALVAKYCLDILATRLATITTDSVEFSSAPHLSLLLEEAVLDPISSANDLLAFSSNLMNTESSEWMQTTNLPGVVVESRAVLVDSGETGSQLLPMHRVRLMVKTNLTESQLFHRLTTVTGLECIYPVSNYICVVPFSSD